MSLLVTWLLPVAIMPSDGWIFLSLVQNLARSFAQYGRERRIRR
ncbi:hypothetical protein MARHY0753 [Marinobacter nauticus ATCC 49840]|nr:hypothetical protein MARHY0753 [Marinobacter nauticus ATCC 49840]